MAESTPVKRPPALLEPEGFAQRPTGWEAAVAGAGRGKSPLPSPLASPLPSKSLSLDGLDELSLESRVDALFVLAGGLSEDGEVHEWVR